jgi:hypothetical protein
MRSTGGDVDVIARLERVEPNGGFVQLEPTLTAELHEDRVVVTHEGEWLRAVVAAQVYLGVDSLGQHR